MSNEAGLFDLSEDILYLVLKELEHDSPASLLNFANSSQSCEKLAGPILYRTITFSDKGDEETQQRTRELFERLLDQNDLISVHVKELVVAEWGEEVGHTQRPQDITHFQADGSEIRNGESRLLLSRELELVLGNLRSLESFSWNSNSLIPNTVITKLEQEHPHVKLGVINNRRHHVDADSAMDVRLLSSRLLSSLDYSIFHNITPSGMVCSEFQALKRCLVPIQRLTNLALGVYNRPPHGVQVPEAPNGWNLYSPAESGDAIWQLHTLKIPQNTIYFDDTSHLHGFIFTQLKDFQSLRRVDLRNVCGSCSFEPLKGRVPNLKHFEFSYSIEDGYNNHTGGSACTGPSSVQGFLGAIKALETLRIVNYASSFGPILPAILQHRDTLHRLSIHSPPDRITSRTERPVMTYVQLKELGKVSHLALDVLISDIAWFLKSDTQNKLDLDPSIALSLVELSRCESLKLYVELWHQESIFSQEQPNSFTRGPTTPLKQKAAEEVALELFQQIFRNDPASSLKELEICFCRQHNSFGGVGMIPGVVYSSVWVKKVGIDYVNAPLAPGYKISSQGKWLPRRDIISNFNVI